MHAGCDACAALAPERGEGKLCLERRRLRDLLCQRELAFRGREILLSDFLF